MCIYVYIYIEGDIIGAGIQRIRMDIRHCHIAKLVDCNQMKKNTSSTTTTQNITVVAKVFILYYC